MHRNEVVSKVAIFLFMNLVWFQKTLESFFPPWYGTDTVMKHRQVVLLICGLMSDPTLIIHLVCKCLVKDGKKSAGKTLIGYMYHEAGLPLPKDFLHNQGINYYDHSEGLIKDTTPVYVPSRSYWFEKIAAKIPFNIQHGNVDVPECTISILSPETSDDLMSSCHRICQYQAVRNLYIEGGGYYYFPDEFLFLITKNTESLTVKSCKLRTETLIHLIQQINGCSALRVLDLSYTTLTGCLSGFLPDPHLVLPELRQLYLEWTSLNKEDLCHLLSIAHKLLKLQALDLSHNTLTGCLFGFLPDPHLGLHELKNLHLSDTKLNKEDLQHLLSIAYKLPKLQALDLSQNSLAGCFSSFLPDPHQGLLELQELELSSTGLNKGDLQHLSHLIQTYKLPRLSNLNLAHNRLSEKESDFENLFETCVTYHNSHLGLDLNGNSEKQFSKEFEEKWKQRCEGTKIELTSTSQKLYIVR